MQASYYSTFLLTLLLAIGLGFFLRAASKDRTTVIEILSAMPPIDVLDGITLWLEERGWRKEGGDIEQKIIRFVGNVSSSYVLAIFLSILCGLGGACLGLVVYQFYPFFNGWPLLFALIGPFAGIFYRSKASRLELFEIRLISSDNEAKTEIRIRAHRDELIALDSELSKKFKLVNDASLTSSPI